MKTYARIESGVVAELLATSGNIALLFHPELTWVDVSAVAGIAEGWTHDGTTFSPPAPAAPIAAAPSLADLQARMSALSAELQSLAAASTAASAQ
jgi:hypothetical protein